MASRAHSSRHMSLPDPAVPPADDATRTAGSYVTVRVAGLHPDQVPFLLERRDQRLGGAIGVSVIAHVVAVAALLLAVYLAPPAPIQPVPERTPSGLVFLNIEGPGGGGGGGGNKSIEPPRKAELKGPDKVALAVEKPPDLKPTPPKPEVEPPKREEVNVPVLSVKSGAEEVPGTLEGLTAPVVTSQGSGTGGGGGTGSGGGQGSGAGTGLGDGQTAGFGGGAYRPGGGITTPVVVFSPRPNYPPDAVRAKIQGEVWVDAVVLPDGTVGDVRVVRSLDATFGIDEEAKRTARRWTFRPGTRQGQPVAVLVTIAIQFNLR